MSKAEYLKTAAEVDMAKHERGIRRAGLAALLISGAGFAAGYHLLPAMESGTTPPRLRVLRLVVLVKNRKP